MDESNERCCGGGVVKIDLFTGKIIEDEKDVSRTEKETIPETKIELKPEDIKEIIEKGKELWRKVSEALETMRREVEKRKIEKVFKEAGVEIAPKKPSKPSLLEEMGIEKL